jgi:putative transposase
MLVREFKLKPTVKQSKAINTALWQMVSVYNTALSKCFAGLRIRNIPSKFDLIAEFSGHGKKAGLNQDAIAEMCKTVRKAFDRWLSKDQAGKRSGAPKKKSKRNKVTSITYGLASRVNAPKNRHINVPGFGKMRCSNQELPLGKIKGGRLVKRASGYYFQYVIDANHVQVVTEDAPEVGIDPGFKTLLTLSDGRKFENPRELRKTAERLAQAQRGKNKKLANRIQERLKRIRQDRNHKISHETVRDYTKIYASDDSFKGLQVNFGKSISEAALSSLLTMIDYKAQSCGRQFIWVNSKNTTRTCGKCLALTGPTGFAGLEVRQWTCPCGAVHDRDINAAQVVYLSGQGMASSEKNYKSPLSSDEA